MIFPSFDVAKCKTAGPRAAPRQDNVTGTTYLLRGRPVVVLARWAGGGPRNVLVEDEDGRRQVRPFRGLRRLARDTTLVQSDRHSAATWARVWDMWLTTTVRISEITAETGVSQSRISEKAAWIRAIDPTFPDGNQRRRLRSMPAARDTSLLYAPGRLGQVRRTRARARGVDVAKQPPGSKPPPQDVIDTIIALHNSGATYPTIAAAISRRVSMVAGAVHRLQKAGVLQMRRPGIGGRPRHD